MQDYLRTTEPCLGVRLPEVRRLTTAAVTASPPASVPELAGAAGELWRGAAHRERYATIALTGLPPARGARSLLPLHEEMITTGAW